MEPGEGPFDHPANLAESGTVCSPTAGDLRSDTLRAQQIPVLVVVVASIGEQPSGPIPRPTPAATNTGNRLDQRHQLGTVTLIEKYSGTSSLVQVATGRRQAVHIQAAASVAVISRQTANRSAISVRHSAAVSRCRRGRKCGEMLLNVDRNRCACPGEVKRFMARSRCRVG